MKITTILFDLDGTLLPMDQDVFINEYFKRISTKLAPNGYEPKSLINLIWKGTELMIKNTGDKSNEEVFWDFAVNQIGDKIVKDKTYFDEFYETEFDKIKSVCGFNEKVPQLIKYLKQKGYKLALATNPVFPSRATQWRIGWAGLSSDDFELITTYENINRSKPNPQYYLEVANRLGVAAQECLMVGNDVGDDMIAEKVGMKVFLLTDCLINKNNEDISVYPNGNFDDLMNYIKSQN